MTSSNPQKRSGSPDGDGAVAGSGAASSCLTSSSTSGRCVESSGDDAERQRERERMMILGAFARELAHDLSNLLFPMRGILETMDAASASGSAAVRDQALQRFHRVAEALDQYARVLRAWGRAEAVDGRGGQTVLSEWLPILKQLVEREFGCDETDNDDDDDYHCIFEFNLAPANVALIDPDLLSQVVRRLLRNARDAMRGGGALTVRLESINPAAASIDRGGGSTLRISIIDDGEGMDSETMRAAFDPFFTTRTSRAAPGLGLTLARGAMRMVGGDIRLESRPGPEGGVIAIIEAPMISGEAAAPSSASSARAAAFGHKTQPARALISVSDPRVAAYVSLCLRANEIEPRIDPGATPDREDSVWIVAAPGSRRDHEFIARVSQSRPDLTIVALGALATDVALPANVHHAPEPLDAAALRQALRRIP